jgi:DNA-binding NarL/FixJ family response regulator
MKPTLVIVDDHAGFRSVARSLLMAHCFEVIGEAADSAAALAEIARLEPDVVLLDVELPDGNGFDIADRLTADGCRAALVLTSSRDRADFGPLVDESPARGFVAKADISGDVLRSLCG